VLFQYGTKIGTVVGDPKHYGPAYGAAGGTLGTNLGAVAALLFMLLVFVVYMRVFKKKMMREKRVKVDSFAYTMKILVITIIPVLLSTTIYNISGIFDMGVFKNIAKIQGYTSDEIDVWWGVFSGKYKVLINVPISIASAMAASSVPTLTKSFAEGNMNGVRSQINAAMRFVMVIAVPCCVGLAVLAKPILLLLFSGTAETADMGSVMMWVGATAVIFYSMSTLSNGLLQGIDKLTVPVKNAVYALVSHLLLLVVLMLFFKLHIYAVVISNAFFALMMCVLNAISLQKYSGYKQEIKKTFLIPILASLIMGLFAFVFYQAMFWITNSNTISLMIAIILAVIIYAVALLLLKGLTEEDILKFPKGSMLLKVFKQLHLLK
jgi:stage V sporulation protein B